MSRNGTQPHRIERDALGERHLPGDAYWGIQTERARENFAISGVPVGHYPNLVRGLAYVKLAAARANHALGQLPFEMFAAIEAACHDILAGRLHEHFIVDVFQGGAGTSTNMNANEVIANRALEHLGQSKGNYAACDPYDHVNMSQSTNDVYPSALKVALLLGNDELVIELGRLSKAFQEKGREFEDVVKMGRTQLQDAVPMTLGQEFTAFGRSLADEIGALRDSGQSLLYVNLGATAVGTGLNAPRGYGKKATQALARLTKKAFRLAHDLVEATQDTRAFVQHAATQKSLAIKLSKIANDLRLLSSGPRAGLFEINLPAVQAGSSIMPGKVNPVIPEVVSQICYRIIANDLTVTLAAEAGQLQLNAMLPVLAHCVLESQFLLGRLATTFREHCVVGITANIDVCQRAVEQSIGVVTALNPVLGYARTSDLAREALATGRGVLELVRERGLMSDRALDQALDPHFMAQAARRD